MTDIPFTGERFVPSVTGRLAYEHQHRYSVCLEAAKDKIVLDIACGEGYGSALLARRAAMVVGVDIDAGTIAAARTKYQNAGNLAFVVGDCRKIPIADASVDLIVCFETIEHIAEHDVLLAEFARVLRPKGAIVISTPDKDVYSGEGAKPNPFHVHELSHGQFEQLLKTHFRTVELYRQRLGMASFLLRDAAKGPDELRSFMSGTSGEPGSRALDSCMYTIAVCARNSAAAIKLNPSLYLDPADDLFLEQEKVLRWASGLHHEQEAVNARQAQALSEAVANVTSRHEAINAELTSRLAASEQTLGDAIRQKDAHQQTIAGLETALAGAQAAHRQLEAAHGELAKQLDAAAREIAHGNQVTSELRNALAAAQQRNIALEQERDSARAEHAAIRSSSERTLADLKAALRTRNEALAERQRILSSTSWRAISLLQRKAQQYPVLHRLLKIAARMAILSLRTYRSLRTKLSSGLRRFATHSASRPLRSLASGEQDPIDPWIVPARLRNVLQVLGQQDAEPRVQAAYAFLESHSQGEIGLSDLAGRTAVRALIAELSARSAARVRLEQPDISVIIPVHNKLAYTLGCLKSVFDFAPNLNFEVIVADDCSSDATDAAVKAIGGIVRPSRNPENLGFTRNCNAAAAVARGRIIVFLNNDTIVLPGWLEELVAALDRDETIGLVGSRLLNTDGSLQEAGGIVWRDGSAWNYGRDGDATSEEFNYARDADYISGASIAIRGSVWNGIGGFDEAYAPAYCEDSDFAFAVRAAGFRTVYQPFSTVIHHEGVSHGRNLGAGIKAHQARNSAIFADKWRDVLEAEHFANGNEVFVARDRSRHRQHILVIDHYIPQPDRDAGSRTLDYFIRLFQASGLQTSLWPHNKYYDRAYAQPLQRLGIEVLYSLDWKDIIDEWLDKNGRTLDYVLLSRADIAARYVERIRAKTSAKILFYGHDVHFRRLEMEYAVTGDPSVKAEAATSAVAERAIWAKCDVLYYPSEDEQRFVQAEAPSKIVRAVPPFIYQGDRLDATRRRLEAGRHVPQRQVLFIGGFRHRPNVDAMLWFMQEIWPDIAAQIPDVTMVIAGSFPPDEIQALAGPNVLVTGAISDAELETLYLATAVAVVPLRFGAGVKGKLFEAMSYGVPVVTTPIGIQGIAATANLVSVCETPEAFGAAVVGILNNPGANSAASLFGLSYVEQTASARAARDVFGLDIADMDDSA